MNKKQFEFSIMLAQLIVFIYAMGYTCSIGDTWAKKGEGRKHSKTSKHYDRLASDINLFKDSIYLTAKEDHAQFGAYWKALGGVWGGDWKSADANHYQHGGS